MKPKIVVVIPTVRPEQYKLFLGVWKELFFKHSVTLITVWDGETPRVETKHYGPDNVPLPGDLPPTTNYINYKEIIYRYTDACRNLGFIAAAHLNPDYVLTLDDDVAPLPYSQAWPNTLGDGRDPIQDHIDTLNKKVPLGWVNTAHQDSPYLRGVPYKIRNEFPVMLSHGVWFGTPDFDGETQLSLEESGKVRTAYAGNIHETVKLTGGVPYSLPYYIGPITRGVLFPLCGMNVMVRREALPYLYFAPMGKDTGIVKERDVDQTSGGTHTFTISLLNRFADIWMGIFLKKEFDRLGWACYTGRSTILHTRASDAKKNFEQEKLGREWNEYITEYTSKDSGWPKNLPDGFHEYMTSYRVKREKFKELVTNLLLENK